MVALELSTLDMMTIATHVGALRVLPVGDDPWAAWECAASSPEVLQGVDALLARARRFNTARANEATLWSRVIYPLMELAERDDVVAWSQVTVSARHPTQDLTIAGVIDGAFARDDLGQPSAPYFLVVEAKRGIDASDPLPQVVGAMLAAGMTRLGGGAVAREVFGAFVVTDKWTFLRGALTMDAAGGLSMEVAPSREYAVRHESLAIVAVMRAIVARGEIAAT
ncbi:MAG: hypothetical protein U0324_10190 [Polyangiales bacterium]